MYTAAEVVVDITGGVAAYTEYTFTITTRDVSKQTNESRKKEKKNEEFVSLWRTHNKGASS